MNYLYVTLCGFALGLLPFDLLSAPADTTYYVSYPHLLTTRFYFSQKYTALTVRDRNENYVVRYRPNTTLNVGLGATYKWATVNLAYGFGFLNNEDEKGKTKYVDLQFHGYGKKFNLDVLGQFYKGFYLYPRRTAALDSYYQRPDLQVAITGASFQYVFNHRRFSFRASVLHNDWQKKSAGTLLFGIEVYGGWLRSDSTLVPTIISKAAAARNEKRTDFFEAGPNLGYAYTLVIKENFFLTGSVSGSLDYGFSSIVTMEGETTRYGFSPNTFLRISTGYNSAKWAVSIVYVNNGVMVPGRSSVRESMLHSGNLRLHYVRRLALGGKEKKFLEVIR